MIDYAEGTVTIFDGEQDVTEKIEKWEVWFHTPTGTWRTFEKARAEGGEAIVPVPVAIGTNIFQVSK